MNLFLEHFLSSQEGISRSFLEFSFFVTQFSAPRFFPVEILQQSVPYYTMIKEFFKKLV